MKCPTCGEELPLLSKVCPVCGCVIENPQDGGMNAVACVETLDAILGEIKALPMPSFGQKFKELQVVFCPLLSVLCLTMALITDAGLFWILAAAFLIAGVIFMMVRVTAKSFNRYKIEFEKEMNSARRLYGKNREMGKELERLSREMTDIEMTRETMRRRNTILWMIMAMVFACACLYLVVK